MWLFLDVTHNAHMHLSEWISSFHFCSEAVATDSSDILCSGCLGNIFINVFIITYCLNVSISSVGAPSPFCSRHLFCLPSLQLSLTFCGVAIVAHHLFLHERGLIINLFPLIKQIHILFLFTVENQNANVHWFADPGQRGVLLFLHYSSILSSG